MKQSAHNDKESFFEKKDEVASSKKLSWGFNFEFLKRIQNKLNSDKRLLFLSVFILSAIVVLLIPNKGELINTILGKAKEDNNEIEVLVDEISEKILLPSSEKPTIATISDIAKLEDQPFFRDAQNGDKVLIYAGVKKAILYRPSIKKIIEVSSIAEGDFSQTTPSTNNSQVPTITPIEPQESLKIVILNGTKEAGLARKASDIIESETVDVVSTGNTSEDYQTTSISSISTSNSITENQLKEIAKDITKVTSKVSSFPTAETKPSNADVVIILGEDFAEQY